jgi:hypothetical protein
MQSHTVSVFVFVLYTRTEDLSLSRLLSEGSILRHIS